MHVGWHSFMSILATLEAYSPYRSQSLELEALGCFFEDFAWALNPYNVCHETRDGSLEVLAR